MAIDIGLRIIQLLDSIGIKGGSYLGKASNVKKAFTGGKATFFKPNALETLRSQDGTFTDALKLIEDEAKYITNATDAEKMAFLNNLTEYKSLGGPPKTTGGITALDEAKNLTDEAGDLQTSIDDLMSTAKKMKDEAEANKNKALQDLDDFFATGGQPFKKKDDKFLGGSMHEESQLRTGIRQFLQTEYKNGRLKLNDLDKDRVMQYSGLIEHDPILVFKKIYGDEAYKKAGSFPGAFEIGEDFKHYEKIFRENMGEDLLKVKNKEYVGDGTLVLTDEVYEPKPDVDDDMPFATGGRASFAGGNIVSKIIAAIVKKEPIKAMKEVNKVIGKKGKYKNLTEDEINKIVDGTNDWIMQRDPDNLYVYDDGKTIYDEDLTKQQLIEKEGRKLDLENIEGTADEMSVEDSLTTMEGLGATQTAERFRLKQKYPGISDELLNNILIDDNPQRKAEVLATIDEAFKMMEKGKGPDEIVQTFKNMKRTKNAKGGRAGFYMGGQSMIEPDLSDIGHGSDSLMSRNRILAPNSQATTSTGLNYLLGEDNDNTRIPFDKGLLVPPPKPYTTDQFDKDSMMLLQGIYGTGKATHPMLYNSIIEKGNKLRKQGVERETVIEIIRNNKDKINAFLETQTTSPKTFKGIDEFEMKADGGRIGYATKGKVDLADLESLKGLKKEREKLNVDGLPSLKDTLATPGQQQPQSARSQREKILDKAIAKFTYAVENLDQETREKVISAFNDQLKFGYETTMSGLKMDAAEKAGFVPIDKETIYKAIVDMDLPKDTKLEMSALANKAGEAELAFSLINNNLGITYDNQSQTIVGEYRFDTKDGKLSITPSITKDEDSKIQSKIEIDKAINNGSIDLDLTKDTTDNSLTTDFEIVKDGNVLSATNVTGGDNNYFTAEGTAKVPFYMLKDGQSPYISSEYYKDDGSNYFETSLGIPITQNLEASLSNLNRYDGSHVNTLGVNYKKYIDNIFTKNKTLDTRGTFSFDANIDSDNNKYAGFQIAFPLSGKKTKDMQGIYFDNEILSPDEERLRKRLEDENTMFFRNKPYYKDNIYSGSDFNELIEATKDNLTIGDFIGPKLMAQGGIANIRQGYSAGKGVDLARRGFLKLLGVTAGGVAALKSGIFKVLGKSSPKAIPKIVEVGSGSGVPSWFEPMVNKVLADGLDITKKNAYIDGQTVKRLETPNGKVDVYHNERTGEIDVDYIGSGTALDEGVQMNYKPGLSLADEGNPRPADEFMATENIPEGQVVGPDDYEIGLGENTVSKIDDLFSDTSELKELGGEKILINDISQTLKKKQKLKQMKDNPSDFVTDVQGDYDPT